MLEWNYKIESEESSMAEKLVCPICGEPTNVYMGNARKDRLCYKHGKMANKGEIALDRKGMWVNATTGEVLTSEKAVAPKTFDKATEPTEKVETPPKSIKFDNGIKCITCGYETNGKLFCPRCYKKYHDKEILVKIKNCIEIEPLDESYEGNYVCDDGHIVKSMAERDIDDFLFDRALRHAYEPELRLKDKNGKFITIHPDFCIFDKDDKDKVLCYIEYWGYDENNRDYTKTKKFKTELYESNGITLINVNAKTDLKNLKSTLKFKLENYEQGKNNFKND